jgi:hypothetical protein
VGEQIHVPTLIWGVILTLFGAAFVAENLGAWSIESLDLRVVGPAVLILIGAVVLVASLGRGGGPGEARRIGTSSPQ